MRRIAWWVGLWALSSSASLAAAQAGPGGLSRPAGGDDVTDGRADEEDAAPGATDAADAAEVDDAEVDDGLPEPPAEGAGWGRFQAAARRAMQVRGPEGRGLLVALAEEDTAVGRAAREMLDALDHTLDAPTPPPPEAPPEAMERPGALTIEEPEHDPTGAIVELAVGQGINGGTMGLSVCILAGCTQPALFAGLSLVGLGAGVTLSILLPNRDFHHGQAAVIGWGGFMGAGYGGLMLGMLSRSRLQGEHIGGTLLLAQALGTGAGIGLAALLDPAEGRVSMAAWGGLWAGALSVMAMGIPSFSGLDAPTVFGVATASTTVGIIGGALLGELYPMGRGRVLLVSAMGALGAGVGMGTTVLITNGYVGEAFWSGAMVGTLTGIILTAALTDGMDAELRAPDVQLSLAPLEDGAVAMLSGSL